MGENTKIEWATHTFNPWWGCVKVSEACKHCYAEAWARRIGQQVWGPKSERRLFGDEHWMQPLRWNAAAVDSNLRPRVFCASMADVFEDRDELNSQRKRLWSLIEATPNLDWLLLTKRPQNVLRLAGWGSQWPENIWVGTTVELQSRADELLPELARIPAKIKFISAEPLLGPLKIDNYLNSTINWVITGGESGPKARPAAPAWFHSLLEQCIFAQVPFHFKQWGDWAPDTLINLADRRSLRRQIADDGTTMVRVGKKVAGRVLEGTHWNGLPKIKAA